MRITTYVLKCINGIGPLLEFQTGSKWFIVKVDATLKAYLVLLALSVLIL